MKLAFRPYGYEVHNLLHAEGFAPKLHGSSKKPEINTDAIVMEYLPPPTDDQPGWQTLHDVFMESPQLVVQGREAIRERLLAIVALLKRSYMVHGDLRSNNIMIKVTAKGSALVQPITVNAIDMEWALCFLTP